MNLHDVCVEGHVFDFRITASLCVNECRAECTVNQSYINFFAPVYIITLVHTFFARLQIRVHP